MYKNFDHSYKIMPKDILTPPTSNDLSKIIHTYKNHKIRINGGHHTFNDISMTNDIMIRTIKMNNMYVDKEHKLISVGSGATLYQIVKELEKYDLALHVLPATLHPSIAGTVSTGTHGSRWDKGPVSDAILSLNVTLANGDIVDVDEKNLDMFMAFNTSLGCLGVINHLILKCDDIYSIKEVEEQMHFDDFIKKSKTILRKYNYTEVRIDFNKNCTVIKRRKVPYKTNPSTVYHKILSSNTEFEPYSEIEIFIELKYLKYAIDDIINLVKPHPHFNILESDMLIRFIGRCKNSFISMSSDHEINVSISLFADASHSRDANLLDIFRIYNEMMVKKYNGRPHYGKKNFMTLDDMKKVYLNVDKFIKIKNELDPDGMFKNDYIKRMLDEAQKIKIS
jgi:FAD/FMN-containing dehydrogenase